MPHLKIIIEKVETITDPDGGYDVQWTVDDGKRIDYLDTLGEAKACAISRIEKWDGEDIEATKGEA